MHDYLFQLYSRLELKGKGKDFTSERSCKSSRKDPLLRYRIVSEKYQKEQAGQFQYEICCCSVQPVEVCEEASCLLLELKILTEIRSRVWEAPMHLRQSRLM